MSSITRADLAASPNLMALLSPEAVKELGLASANNVKLMPSCPPPTLNDLWSDLTPAQKKRLRGTEAKEHAIFDRWLNQNNLPHIHAPTSRKVHDLPPGWPDFTLFHQPLDAQYAKALFIEFKVPGGVLSWEQKQWAKLFRVQICPSAFAAIGLAANFFHLDLDVLKPVQEELPHVTDLLQPPPNPRRHPPDRRPQA